MTEEITMTVISNILNSGAVSALLFAGLLFVWRENRQLINKIDAKDAIILDMSGRIAKLEGKHEAYQTVVDKFSRVEEALEIAMIKQNSKA
jgi:hypothetical protein